MNNTNKNENLISEDAVVDSDWRKLKCNECDENKVEVYSDDDEYDDAYDDAYDYEDNDEYTEEVAVKDVSNEEDLTRQDMADFLKIFGDYSRIKILENIMDIQYTVGDLAIFTGLTHSAVSHHLKILKQAKIVVGVRSGKYVYYRVADKHIREIYDLTRRHIEEFQKTISAKDENQEMAEIFDKMVWGDN